MPPSAATGNELSGESLIRNTKEWLKNINSSLPMQTFKYGYSSSAPTEDRANDLRFWQNSANRKINNGTPDIEGLPISQRIPYWGGRIAGDVVGDLSRNVYWRYNHPLAITRNLAESLPQKAGLKGRGLATLTGFGLATVLDLTSGNTDITNLDEFGRPKGYSAIFPSPEDPTKSQAPLLEPLVGYVVGRKGKLLPYEKFAQERPDVSPEDYQQYSDYQGFNKPGLLGLEKADPIATGVIGAGVGAAMGAKYLRPPEGTPVNKSQFIQHVGKGALLGAIAPATANLISRMGLVKGTWENLDNQPEVQVFGYKVPLSAAAMTAGAGALAYAAMKNKAEKRAALERAGMGS